MYEGSVTGINGVALAGKIGYTNANTKISSIPIHHTGKLLLMTAKVEVILSSFEFILLPESVPRSIPISETIRVAVVKSRIVRGIFSSIMSLTSDEPASLVRNFACPKSSVKIF